MQNCKDDYLAVYEPHAIPHDGHAFMSMEASPAGLTASGSSAIKIEPQWMMGSSRSSRNSLYKLARCTMGRSLRKFLVEEDG